MPPAAPATVTSQFDGRWRSGLTKRIALAHDASHILLTPKAVLKANGSEDVIKAMTLAAQHKLPITFRSGGTSLSGQAASEGLLIDTRTAFRQVIVSPDATKVTCGPGATIQSVNTALARHGRMLGPDPASAVAATIGGVVANNSSGMACGTDFNTYQTLDSLVFVL
ncbi:MAG: FAD-dependent oxidoreductase, partial [Micrococcales bacterium]|nr:FAD-dependent oxidoreductase [Micrococcales bacterium]